MDAEDKGYFEIGWTVEDGYVNGGRKWTVAVSYDELPTDPKELEEYFDAVVHEDSQDKVHSCGLNKKEFLEWAKQMRKASRGRRS